MDKPLSFHAFELLYWTGIRCGELLALTPSDFMLESSRLRINKSYQSLHGVDTVTDPKTPKSVRTIVMPAFLRDEMADFIELRDDVAPDERLFAVTKHFLAHEMERGVQGVWRETHPHTRHTPQPREPADRDGLLRAGHRRAHGPRGGGHHLPIRAPVPHEAGRDGRRP